MTTKIERYRRMSALEQAIAERGWSMRVKRSLATDFGVTTRTIDRYREDLIKTYYKELKGRELDESRAEFLGRLRGHQRTALEELKFGPLASMLGLEGRILGLGGEPEAAPARSVEVVLRVPEYAPDEE